MKPAFSQRAQVITGLGALGVVTLAIVLTATPVASVQTVAVTGVDGRLKQSAQVAASSAIGEPLVRLDTDELRRKVLALSPSLREVDVRRVLPSTVEVTVVPRKPILQWQDQKTSTSALVDAEGAVFGQGVSAPKGTPLLVVSGDLQGADRAAAVADAAVALEALPAQLRKSVKSMRVQTPDDIRFALRGGRDVRWGNTGNTEAKSAVLLGLLKAVPAKVYDVSAPELPTTRRGS